MKTLCQTSRSYSGAKTAREPRTRTSIAGGPPSRGLRRAFTLTEILVAMSILLLVVTAVISSHLLGLKMFNIAATRLSASAGARATLNHLRDEIRSSKTVYVGAGSELGFTNVLDNQPQQGNALQIFPTTSSNLFVRYYLDASRQQLERLATGDLQPQVIARFVTNEVVFQAEDCFGNVLTNHQNNRVVHLTLDFYQWEFPVARVGGGAFYDLYQLNTRITRRAIE